MADPERPTPSQVESGPRDDRSPISSGCGGGSVTSRVARISGLVHGIDLMRSSLAWAAGQSPRSVPPFVRSAFQVPDPSKLSRGTGRVPSAVLPMRILLSSDSCAHSSRFRATALRGRGAREGRSARVASVPAHALQHNSAVARFDSSSPHGVAARRNQEKTR